MKKIEDISQKRAVLLTTRLRFSPQTQSIKQVVTDKIVEQILTVANDGKGLTAGGIQSIFSSESGGHTIGLPELRDSINRLLNQERVEVAASKGQTRLYRLSEKAQADIEEIQREASRRLEAVVNRLFRNAKEESSVYFPPFLECLSCIFSRLGEEYVRVISGEVSKEDFLIIPFVTSALARIKGKYGLTQAALFDNAITSFFQESDPEYDIIKWNMTQNYFVTKALGLDVDVILLFKEVFGNATFYIDTNLIIPALEPRDEDHESFKVLYKACKRLNTQLKVCQISLDELNRWVDNQRELIKKVEDQIPKEIEQKVHSPFYQMYEDRQSSGEIVDIDEIFTNFSHPKDCLEEYFQVEFEDDPWFDEAINDPEIIKFAKTLRVQYSDTRIRRRPKTKRAALHDALLFFWLQKLREESNHNTWIITADTSLPVHFQQPSQARSGSLAITQDALLQWISPIGVHKEDEKDFAAVFAELIKKRLLPHERVFDLEDFLIFHELNMSCKHLPAEDVEACIQHIRENAPMLNPLEPADREKLSSRVSRFFATPGRKYKSDITRLENELESTKREHEEELTTRDAKFETLEKDFQEFKKLAQEESLRRSARFRIGIVAFIFLILELIVIFLASYHGEGTNAFQRILSSWPFFGIAVPAVTILMGWFLIGRERLELLGWPFTKIFKQE